MSDKSSADILNRRKFLGAAGLAGAGAALGATPAMAESAKPDPLITDVQDWQRYLGDGVDKKPYGVPSKFEKNVIRRDVPWLTASPESSVNFTPLHELDGIITPSGLCFERHHSGVAEINPADHRLMINGLVDKPLVFTMADIKRMPRVNKVYFLECAANSGMEWRGAQGYPLRAVIPGWEGNLWVKWLRRIEAGDQPWQTREETSKYTDLLADGRSRKHTFIMDAKSVVTNPSPQAPLKHKGRNVLSGLAWSGRGTVKRVDVSLDGGRNWQTARIDGPVLDKSLVRFYVDFDWNGQELMVQSRAMDSTGYVQPTKDELRKVRGVNSIYHNNGIQTWLVRSTGETENVEIG